jgi:hypothetical protein
MRTSVALVYAAFHRHKRVAGLGPAEAYQSRHVNRRENGILEAFEFRRKSMRVDDLTPKNASKL